MQKLDFVPSSPGLLLLPSQPNNRENVALRHTDEDHWSQQNNECIYHTVNIWEGKLGELERHLTDIDFYILSISVLIYYSCDISSQAESILLFEHYRYHTTTNVVIGRGQKEEIKVGCRARKLFSDTYNRSEVINWYKW